VPFAPITANPPRSVHRCARAEGGPVRGYRAEPAAAGTYCN